MRNRNRFPCTHLKACHCHWAVRLKGWTLTQAAIALELNVGTVCYVIHGRRFPDAHPICPPGFE
jgi:hypothetical protein